MQTNGTIIPNKPNSNLDVPKEIILISWPRLNTPIESSGENKTIMMPILVLSKKFNVFLQVI